MIIVFELEDVPKVVGLKEGEKDGLMADVQISTVKIDLIYP